MLGTSNIEFSPDEVSRYYDVRVPELNQRGSQWRGPCPIHHGTSDNFSVEPDTGVWFCHSRCGCGGDILALEMELTGVDFKTAKPEVFKLIGRDEPDQWRIVGTYEYLAQDGKLLFQVIRRERGHSANREKDFRQRRPDGNGGWIWNLKGVTRTACLTCSRP